MGDADGGGGGVPRVMRWVMVPLAMSMVGVLPVM